MIAQISHRANERGLNIVCAADDGYAMPLAVTIYSALERLSSTAARVFVLDDGISTKNRERVLASWSGLSVKPVWITLSEEDIRLPRYLRRCLSGSTPAARLLPLKIASTLKKSFKV